VEHVREAQPACGKNALLACLLQEGKPTC
jgi:hypothetical protein